MRVEGEARRRERGDGAERSEISSDTLFPKGNLACAPFSVDLLPSKHGREGQMMPSNASRTSY
jgi:hypothetical protein